MTRLVAIVLLAFVGCTVEVGEPECKLDAIKMSSHRGFYDSRIPNGIAIIRFRCPSWVFEYASANDGDEIYCEMDVPYSQVEQLMPWLSSSDGGAKW